jgi:hypothetical protein
MPDVEDQVEMPTQARERDSRRVWSVLGILCCPCVVLGICVTCFCAAFVMCVLDMGERADQKRLRKEAERAGTSPGVQQTQFDRDMAAARAAAADVPGPAIQ